MPTGMEDMLPPKLTKNQEFLKNCQIIWFLVVMFWWTDSWLLGDCQATVWMVCWWKENCQMREIIKWKESKRQELRALAESRKQKYGCYNINILGRCLTANLPNRGKHRAHDGQARCPTWASTVPNFQNFWVENKGQHNKEMTALVLRYYIERPNDRLGVNPNRTLELSVH